MRERALACPSSDAAIGCPPDLVDEMSRAEAETAKGRRLHLRVALDYSARDAISRVLAAAAEPMSSAATRSAGSSRRRRTTIRIRPTSTC